MTAVITKAGVYTVAAIAFGVGAVAGWATAEPVKRIGRSAVNRVTKHTKTTETDTEVDGSRLAPEPAQV